MKEDKYGLRPLWDALLEIYDVFARICDKHGLRYYGFAGTALGAVRHKGFIPWDDDLDVAMPRPDYEKFIAIARQELPDNLKFVNWKNTPELNLLAGKIQETRKDVVLDLEKKLGFVLSNGVFIDVYPIDGYPVGVSYWLTKVKVLLLDVIWWRERSMFGDLSLKGKIKWLAGFVAGLVFPKYRVKSNMMAKFESLLLDFPFETSMRVGDIGYTNTIFLHPSLPKEVWGEPIWGEFDGRRMPLPTLVAAHLANNYGQDYMTLPPLEKQCPTHTFQHHFAWWLGPTKK